MAGMGFWEGVLYAIAQGEAHWLFAVAPFGIGGAIIAYVVIEERMRRWNRRRKN